MCSSSSGLASFHGREAAMVFSSAYAAMMGILPPLITAETAVHQRRAQSQLHHQCDPPRPPARAAGLSAWRPRRARGAARGGGEIVPARHHRHRRRVQHARRPRALGGDRRHRAPARCGVSRERARRRRRLTRHRRLRLDRPRHRGAHGGCCRHPGRDARQGLRGQWRLRRRQPRRHRLSARDLALLCLFQSDRARRSGRRGDGGGASSTARSGAICCSTCTRWRSGSGKA